MGIALHRPWHITIAIFMTENISGGLWLWIKRLVKYRIVKKGLTVSFPNIGFHQRAAMSDQPRCSPL